MLLTLLACLQAALAPDLRLSDTRSLRTPGLDPLLRAYHAATLDSGRTGHILPGEDTGLTAGGLTLLRRRDTALILHPKLGAEWRDYRNDGLYASDIGFLLEGATDRMAFWVDARMHMNQTSTDGKSWDGQYQEFQKDGSNSNLTYTSFTRFEGKLNAETSLGRIGLGRTREHWGPSVEYPLVLGNTVSPMPLIDWTLSWGNFRIRELWASLDIDGAGQFRGSRHTRSLYGHRYEWLATPWLTLGASEALILYDHEEVAGLIPMAPLFMEKGQGLESDNNGELAFDLEVRPTRGLRAYSEFLVDDVSEPTSLFNDLWKNRWAVTVGLQGATKWRGNDLGTIIEYSHVEPWVYAHYESNSVQAAHQGCLLGNQSGPNSRSIKTVLYGIRGAAHLSGSWELVWKGTDLGSRWTDTLSDNDTTKKTFLAGGGKLYNRLELHLGYSFRYLTCWLDLGKTLSWADLQKIRSDAPVAVRLETGW